MSKQNTTTDWIFEEKKFEQTNSQSAWQFFRPSCFPLFFLSSILSGDFRAYFLNTSLLVCEQTWFVGVLYSVCVVCVLFVEAIRERIWVRVNFSGVLWVLHGESQCLCWARWLRWWSSCHPPRITSRETTNTNWNQKRWPIPRIMIR